MEITFNVEKRTVEFSKLPARETIVFSLESLEHFLNFLSSNDLYYGCDIVEYTNDEILVNLQIDDENEENILLIKKDRIKILLEREDIF